MVRRQAAKPPRCRNLHTRDAMGQVVVRSLVNLRLPSSDLSGRPGCRVPDNKQNKGVQGPITAMQSARTFPPSGKQLCRRDSPLLGKVKALLLAQP
jgi:hypothetical protein